MDFDTHMAELDEQRRLEREWQAAFDAAEVRSEKAASFLAGMLCGVLFALCCFAAAAWSVR